MTLTKKMLRQPTDSVSTPPTVGPMARPTDAIPVQMPMARALRPGSGNAALTRASEATLTAAAPTPWRPRPMFRMQARSQPADRGRGREQDGAEDERPPPALAVGEG